MAGPRLTRDLQHSMMGGVCAGFARRYDFDVTLVRIVLVLLTVATGGIGIPLYVVAWIVVPREDAPEAAPRAAEMTPDSLAKELREVSERLSEAARVLAGKTREAAEEISEIARRAPAASTAANASANAASVTSSMERRGDAAESAPPASIEETQAMANGREADEGMPSERVSRVSNLPPDAPANTPAIRHDPSARPPSALPPVASEQSPNPPPPPPAGPVPPTPPAP